MTNKQIKPITPETMMKLAIDILYWLHKNSMDTMINIYVANKHLSFDPSNTEKFIKKTLKDETIYYESIDHIDVKKQIEYCNPETLTITFEGPMYHDINYGKAKSLDYISKRAGAFGCYVEQGYAWSLSLYE